MRETKNSHVCLQTPIFVVTYGYFKQMKNYESNRMNVDS